jgi:hypothetical protein
VGGGDYLRNFTKANYSFSPGNPLSRLRHRLQPRNTYIKNILFSLVISHANYQLTTPLPIFPALRLRQTHELAPEVSL